MIDYDIAISPDGYERAVRGWGTYHSESGMAVEGITIHVGPDGERSLWPPRDAIALTYCVSEDFGAHYEEVVSALRLASEAWSEAARVRFEHRQQHDANCGASSPVKFDVQPISNRGFIAVAFFPREPRELRTIFVDRWNAFGGLAPPLTLPGIMRHELGHTLGLRHEHIRHATAERCREDGPWEEEGEIDTKSVMHYPWCSGTNLGDLEITDADRRGIRSLYGAPLSHGSAPALAGPAVMMMENQRLERPVTTTDCVDGTVTAFSPRGTWGDRCRASIGSRVEVLRQTREAIHWRLPRTEDYALGARCLCRRAHGSDSESVESGDDQ